MVSVSVVVVLRFFVIVGLHSSGYSDGLVVEWSVVVAFSVRIISSVIIVVIIRC